MCAILATERLSQKKSDWAIKLDPVSKPNPKPNKYRRELIKKMRGKGSLRITQVMGWLISEAHSLG